MNHKGKNVVSVYLFSPLILTLKYENNIMVSPFVPPIDVAPWEA